MALTADSVRKVAAAAPSFSVGIISIGDLEVPHITFNHGVSAILGYSDFSLNRHVAEYLFNGGESEALTFFEAVKDGAIDYPDNIKIMNMLGLDRAAVAVRVLCRYFPDPQTYGVYVLLIQSASEDAEKLKRADREAHRLLEPGGKLGQGARIMAFRISKLFSQVFTGTAIVGLLSALLVNPSFLGTVIKSFSLSKQYSDNAQIASENISTFAASDAARSPMLGRIRDELSKVEPNIKAIAYYRLNEVPALTGEANLTSGIAVYGIDSNDQSGEETFFRDQPLTDSQIRTLRQLRCIYLRNLGEFVDRAERPKFDGILCPTFYIFNAKEKDKVPRIETINIIAVALEKPIDPNGVRAHQVETAVFKRGVAVEPLVD